MDSALQLELSEQILDRSITLARTLLQSYAVEHVHTTVRIANDAVLLQRAGDHVHGLPRRAEHHREEFLTELECLAATRAIVRAIKSHRQQRASTVCRARQAADCTINPIRPWL